MPERMTIRLEVNGRAVSCEVEPRTHLIDFLRDSMQIKGARVGCEHGVCGACTVRLDGSECFAAGNLPKRFMGSFLGAKNLLLEPQAKIAGSFQCSGNGGRDRD